MYTKSSLNLKNKNIYKHIKQYVNLMLETELTCLSLFSNLKEKKDCLNKPEWLEFPVHIMFILIFIGVILL